MKTTCLTKLFFLFMLTVALTACDDGETRLSPVRETVLEGEASDVEINISRPYWTIAAVTGLDGYLSPGSGPSQLEGLGSLSYGNWATIVHDEQDRLIIRTEDNFHGYERGFIIHLRLKGGIYREQITVKQKMCENFYQIKSLEYRVETGDGITEAAPSNYRLGYHTDYEDEEREPFKVYPFLNHPAKYEFRFDNYSTDVFQWLGTEEYTVPLPDRIEEGTVISGDKTGKFATNGQYWKDEELRNKYYLSEIVVGKMNRYITTIYRKQMKLTVILTLHRPGSDNEKVFVGKFIQTYPYDCAPIEHKIEEYDPNA